MPEWARNECWKGKDYLPTGTVKWFNATKGFGFIEPDGGGPDAFVHISALERAGMSGLSEGQKVQYDLESGRDGKSKVGNLQAAEGDLEGEGEQAAEGDLEGEEEVAID